MSLHLDKVGVVGCGLMGSGIAEVCARAGTAVAVVEADDRALAAGRDRVAKSMDRAVRTGKLSEQERGDVEGRMRFTCDFDVLFDRDLVVEAVTEHEAAKFAVLAKIDAAVANEEALLTSNTSSIPIIKLAMATRRPHHVLGLHFFNPVPVLSLVEIVPSLLTDDDVLTTVEAFVRDQLGKRPVRCKDRAGFVVNALLIPYVLSAIRMLESGFASAEDIDTGMVEGCAHPMGPLALADLIGLDTMAAVANSLYEEFKEPLYAPPPMLSRLIEAGLLGRKTGRGFYTYTKAAKPTATG